MEGIVGKCSEKLLRIPGSLKSNLGIEGDCRKMFRIVATDSGFCCAFNNHQQLQDSFIFNHIYIYIQGVPKNMGIHWRIRYRHCYELAWQYLISKAIKIVMSARVYCMKSVKDCKNVSIMSDEQWRWTSLLWLHTAIFLFY